MTADSGAEGAPLVWSLCLLDYEETDKISLETL
jgi:hypothetical protein